MSDSEAAQYSLFVTCAKGIEDLLQSELSSYADGEIKQTVTGVMLQASLENTLRICLWSRLANRVILLLASDAAADADDLYALASAIPWTQQFDCAASVAVDFSGSNDSIRNSQFGAQRIKDAIVDQFRDAGFERPRVDLKEPDIRVNVRLTPKHCYIGIDLSGDSLHRRNYRGGQGFAPLKENLAAALLTRARWQDSDAGDALLDPMCGSATLLIEAAMMSADIAPGLLRKRWGFSSWRDFDPDLWQKLLDDARARREQGLANLSKRFVGLEKSRKVFEQAKDNVLSLELQNCIQIYHCSFDELPALIPTELKSGLAICNPPYGNRLGEKEALAEDYRDLAQVCKRTLSGWRFAVFSADRDLLQELRLRADKKYTLYNGGMECELRLFTLRDSDSVAESDRPKKVKELSAGAQMLANRLRKNQSKYDKWRRDNGIDCYRVYDADMPEYAVAIDLYHDCLHIQEYQAPKSIDAAAAERRFREVIDAVREVFSPAREKLFTKQRRRTRGAQQYEKLRDVREEDFFTVDEGPAKFWINLVSYLDTGLFLDHRPLRRILLENSRDKTFLNLFCYTASASVMAALGGAKSSLSIDMSNTYLSWAENNFSVNAINMNAHKLLRADVVSWLETAHDQFDQILLDPPSFSNSKRMEDTLDIQRDHQRLVQLCMQLLRKDGVLYFSNNLRSFTLSPELEQQFDIVDIGRESIDPDFQRNLNIHHCWKITHTQ